MSIYHFWASGFGLVREVLHRGIHISFVIGLVFLLFSWKRKKNDFEKNNSSFLNFQNIDFIDYVFAFLAISSALYLPLLPPEVLAQRVGNPQKIDVFMGSILIILTLEAARRSVGATLPLISIIFILFAIFGPYAPGALKHGGTSWLGFVNHIYITNQGVYGIAVGVMAQYVFLFILFGVLATKVGLGKLFIDLSVPRNIDPKLSSNHYIELVDIDQLNAEADKTLDKRKKDIPKAKTIINLHKLEFEDWSKLHTLGPTIKNLNMTFEEMKNSEIEKYKGQYQQNELKRIKPLIDSIVKKISSKNIEYLRSRYRVDEDILEVMREMYKIN